MLPADVCIEFTGGAVIDGAHEAGLGEALIPLVPLAATREQLLRVHTQEHVNRIEQVVQQGGGRLDPDTRASSGSWTAMNPRK